MNVNFEPIIRGLKSDIFEVENPFHICRIQLQKKKSGVKNVWKFVPLRGGGGGGWTPNGKYHLRFPFDY